MPLPWNASIRSVSLPPNYNTTRVTHPTSTLFLRVCVACPDLLLEFPFLEMSNDPYRQRFCLTIANLVAQLYFSDRTNKYRNDNFFKTASNYRETFIWSRSLANWSCTTLSKKLQEASNGAKHKMYHYDPCEFWKINMNIAHSVNILVGSKIIGMVAG